MSLKITNVPHGEQSYTHRSIWTAIIVLLIVLMAIVAVADIIGKTLFWLEYFGS